MQSFFVENYKIKVYNTIRNEMEEISMFFSKIIETLKKRLEI